MMFKNITVTSTKNSSLQGTVLPLVFRNNFQTYDVVSYFYILQIIVIEGDHNFLDDQIFTKIKNTTVNEGCSSVHYVSDCSHLW